MSQWRSKRGDDRSRCSQSCAANCSARPYLPVNTWYQHYQQQPAHTNRPRVDYCASHRYCSSVTTSQSSGSMTSVYCSECCSDTDGTFYPDSEECHVRRRKHCCPTPQHKVCQQEEETEDQSCGQDSTEAISIQCSSTPSVDCTIENDLYLKTLQEISAVRRKPLSDLRSSPGHMKHDASNKSCTIPSSCPGDAPCANDRDIAIRTLRPCNYIPVSTSAENRCQGQGAQSAPKARHECHGDGTQSAPRARLECHGKCTQSAPRSRHECQGQGAQSAPKARLECQGGGSQSAPRARLECQGETTHPGTELARAHALWAHSECQGDTTQSAPRARHECQGQGAQSTPRARHECHGDGSQSVPRVPQHASTCTESATQRCEVKVTQSAPRVCQEYEVKVTQSEERVRQECGKSAARVRQECEGQGAQKLGQTVTSFVPNMFGDTTVSECVTSPANDGTCDVTQTRRCETECLLKEKRKSHDIPNKKFERLKREDRLLRELAGFPCANNKPTKQGRAEFQIQNGFPCSSNKPIKQKTESVIEVGLSRMVDLFSRVLGLNTAGRNTGAKVVPKDSLQLIGRNDCQNKANTFANATAAPDTSEESKGLKRLVPSFVLDMVGRSFDPECNRRKTRDLRGGRGCRRERNRLERVIDEDQAIRAIMGFPSTMKCKKTCWEMPGRKCV